MNNLFNYVNINKVKNILEKSEITHIEQIISFCHNYLLKDALTEDTVFAVNTAKRKRTWDENCLMGIPKVHLHMSASAQM